MKSCLICDDHALVREALSGMVGLGWPDARITDVGDFPTAWAEAANGYDVCIADLVMPGASPIEGIEGLKRAAPDMAILIVTGTQDDALLLDLLDLGVSGFAPKTASGAIIEAALRLIEAGGRYLPPRLAEIAAARVDAGFPHAATDEPVAPGRRITDRQRDVVRLAAQGLSNKEIARVLDLAPSTVKSHLAHVQDYLGAKNRTEASIKARALNLF